MKPMHGPPPSLTDIEAIALEVRDSLPEPFRHFAAAIVLRVEDFPDAEIEREMELDSPFDLLGLYQGTSVDQKSVTATPEHIDMIFLYRRPLLDYWCETAEDLAHVVRHVMIHEIGHHFGFSDDDMERIEQAD